MNRKVLIEKTIKKINQLPDTKLREINDFIDFLLSKIDDNIIRDGVQKLTSDSESFNFLSEEEELYTVKDLKKRFK